MKSPSWLFSSDADGRLQRHRLLGDADDAPHLGGRPAPLALERRVERAFPARRRAGSPQRLSGSSSSISSAISSELGSRPSSCTSRRWMRISRLIVSTMCTGMRMVRAWSAIARLMAWRIHHVA